MDAAPEIDTDHEAAPGGGPGKLYALAVVALAVFLAGLIAWHEPIRGHAARAVVHYQRPQVPGLEPRGATAVEEIAAAILSEGTLRKIAGELKLSTADEAALGQRTTALRERLVVETVAGGQPGQARIAIRYLGDSPEESLRIVDALARDFVQLHHGSLDDSEQRRALEQAEQAVAEAAREAERAQAQLDAFLAEHLPELRKAPASPTARPQVETTSPADPPPASPVAGPPPAPEVTPVQPPVAEQMSPAEAPPAASPPPASQPAGVSGVTPRQALMQQIEALQRQQAELAAERTWADPAVRALGDEIQGFERQLRATPFDPLAPAAPALPTPEVAPASSRAPRDHASPARPGRLTRAAAPPARLLAPATTAPVVAKAEEAKRARQAKLQRELEGLQRHQAAAFERWNVAVAQQQRAAAAMPGAPRIAATIAEPPTVVGQVGGGIRSGVVVWWGMASLLIGVLVASFAGEPEDRCPLLSADEASQQLELPVIGRLAIGNGPPRGEPAAATPGWTWTCVHVAELVLVGMAVFMTVRLLGDSPLAGRMLGDPLGAFADAWRPRG